MDPPDLLQAGFRHHRFEMVQPFPYLKDLIPGDNEPRVFMCHADTILLYPGISYW
jgi:hypothetical protein